MKIAIIIPARYGSTRFPGKPLALIAGKTMLQRVVHIANTVAEKSTSSDQIDVLVTTEDQRIEDHCREIGVRCIVTSFDCPTGSDRILEAAQKSGTVYDFIIGLQGDAPFTPIDAIHKMINAVTDDTNVQVVTPVVRLRWTELDALRNAKKQTPFSGTTAVINTQGRALWFSKTILPAIRKEAQLRSDDGDYSPVYQHLGLYGYKPEALERFVSLPQSAYEKLEGLEQLRLIENDIAVQTVTITTPSGLAQAGIDSPEDITRAENLIAKHGELFT